MTLVDLIVVLVVVGVLLWAIQQFPAIDPTIKQIIRVLVVVFAVLYVLQMVGLISGFNTIRVR